MHVTHREQMKIRERIDRQSQVQIHLKILEASCMLFLCETRRKLVED